MKAIKVFLAGLLALALVGSAAQVSAVGESQSEEESNVADVTVYRNDVTDVTVDVNPDAPPEAASNFPDVDLDVGDTKAEVDIDVSTQDEFVIKLAKLVSSGKGSATPTTWGQIKSLLR
ncbi:MAG: hypothetical protein ACE5OR_09620 [bacterium]